MPQLTRWSEISIQRSINRQPLVAPESLVTGVTNSSDTNIPDVPARIVSRVAELQFYIPNAPEAVTTQDSEVVGPGCETNNTQRDENCLARVVMYSRFSRSLNASTKIIVLDLCALPHFLIKIWTVTYQALSST